MPGSQGSGPAPIVPGSARRQSRTAARSSADVQFARTGCEVQRGEGFCAGGGEQDEVGAQGRPGGVVGDARDDPVGTGLEAGDGGGAEVVFGGDVEGVEVAGGGGAEPHGGGGVVAGGGGGRDGGVVAGQDALEDLRGGRRADVLGLQEVVGVAVADDLEVEVVGVGPRVSIV